MTLEAPEKPGLLRLGPAVPACPVIVSVPHAGRIYPAELLREARFGETELAALEDRLVDRLAAPLAEAGFTVFVARHARAWLDLNRSEQEYDPQMIAPVERRGNAEITAKVRGGLGLVPRRLPGRGDIYARPIGGAALRERIAAVHRPYHAALSDALDAARRRFGAAMLLDCHSMPPLKPKRDMPAADIVLGDLDGTSAGEFLIAAAQRACEQAGYRVARNDPYAGGYILKRHGRPERAVHALQFEISRAAYLDGSGRAPGRGFERAAELLGALAERLCDELMCPPEQLAAE